MLTVLWVILILLFLVFVITGAIFLYAFRSPDRRQNDDHELMHTPQMKPLESRVNEMIDRLNEVEYERVSVTSFDGLRLQGRLYFRGADRPVVIGFHGYRGTPSRDFSGGAQMYINSGLNLLMVEQRAHCGSEGHVITYGVKERFDCLTWTSYAAQRFGPETPILLAGISMGAATVLMASELDLPPNVRGIVADAPYTSPRAIIRKVCADMRVPPGLAYPFLWLGARIFGGFGLSDADASEAVRHARVPILLIHGEDDRFVPCDMGRAIAAANPDMIRLETFPDAGHGLSFLVDQPRYERIVREFFQKTLGEHARFLTDTEVL